MIYTLLALAMPAFYMLAHMLTPKDVETLARLSCIDPTFNGDNRPHQRWEP